LKLVTASYFSEHLFWFYSHVLVVHLRTSFSSSHLFSVILLGTFQNISPVGIFQKSTSHVVILELNIC